MSISNKTAMEQNPELFRRYENAWKKLRDSLKFAKLHVDARIRLEDAERILEALPEAFGSTPTLLMNISLEQAVFYFEGITNNKEDLAYCVDMIYDYATSEFEGVAHYVIDKNQIDITRIVQFACQRFDQFVWWEIQKHLWHFNGSLQEYMKKEGLV